MTLAGKMGTTAMVLATGGLLPGPFGAICVWLACLFGVLAGLRGSRWWFALPVSIVSVVAVVMIVLTQSGAYR